MKLNFLFMKNLLSLFAVALVLGACHPSRYLPLRASEVQQRDRRVALFHKRAFDARDVGTFRYRKMAKLREYSRRVDQPQ